MSCEVARPWQNVATLLRAARTQEMFLKIFRNIFCVRHEMLHKWQNESTFGKHDHVSNVAATMCPRFAGPSLLPSKWTTPSIWSMDPDMRPSVIIWDAILSACRQTNRKWASRMAQTRHEMSFEFLKPYLYAYPLYVLAISDPVRYPNPREKFILV